MPKLSNKRIRFDRENQVFEGMDHEVISYLKYLFPAINIPIEIEKMKAWLNEKGTKTIGTLQFILNWLSRHPLAGHKDPDQCIYSAEPGSLFLDIMQSYCEEMWKKHPSLYVFNTIRR